MKRHTSILLAFLMLASLTACGSTTVEESADTAAVAETAAETETEEYTSPGIQYDGREFIFSAWKTDNPNWVATQYFEAGSGEQDGDPINEALYYRNLQVEEALDVKIVANPCTATKRARCMWRIFLLNTHKCTVSL